MYHSNKSFCKSVIAFIVCVFSALAVIYVFLRINKVYNIGLFCAFREITGLYCAGCGMTRATLSLLKLDFYQAFRYNAFSIILLPMLFLYFVGEVYAYCFGKKNFMVNRVHISFWIVVVVLMLIYGVLRNIPYFSFLSPTIVG